VPVTDAVVAILDALGYARPADAAQTLDALCAPGVVAGIARRNAYTMLCGETRLFSPALVTCAGVGFKGRAATAFEQFVLDRWSEGAARTTRLPPEVRDKLVCRMRERLRRRFPDLAGKLAAAEEQARVYQAVDALMLRVGAGDRRSLWDKFVTLRGVLPLLDMPEEAVASMWTDFVDDANNEHGWSVLAAFSVHNEAAADR
jgi:hypothetical protein